MKAGMRGLANCLWGLVVAGGLVMTSDGTDWADPGKLSPPPPQALGYPSRAADLDVLPGFQKPPPGYGEVAFYWWLGDPLTKERLTWQLDQLADHHVSGLQINYAHTDAGGRSYGLTFPSDPPLFSEAWWELFRWFLGECRKRGIATSLSDYTLCAPGQGWWTDEIIRERPDLRGSALESTSRDVAGGETVHWKLPEAPLDLRAWPTRSSSPSADQARSLDLRSQVVNGELHWNAPPGSWQLRAVSAKEVPLSIDPMHPQSGAQYLARFFQRFEDRTPGEGGRGLNFFFSDELDLGVGGKMWNDRFAAEFRQRKGYDLLPEIAALFTDIGPRTPKVRLDYSDVLVALSEEGFFRPIFDWHRSRGMLFGCDHGGRGRDVTEFGDYFRTQRWMTGPGNDSPFLTADVVKNKVASSITHLYERPRTWLEGFHSSGWGTTSAQVADATFRNFVSGHNLLTLHGLYYSTHGGFWEWAPPCNHFRMPYWSHLREFLGCSERISYLLSQGVHVCDIAILYPVAPKEAGLGGDDAVRTAFQIGPELFDQGLDFDFIDFESLDRATIRDRNLQVSGESYRVLILPAMRAIRWSTLQKALAFHRAGGLVLAVGALPEASDRMGRLDPEVDAAVREMFGAAAGETPPTPGPRWFADGKKLARSLDRQVPPDFLHTDASNVRQPAKVLHRRIGPRDVYMVHGAPRGAECRFRAVGSPELWDPWTGRTRPLPASSLADTTTSIRLPLQPWEAQIIVFNPSTNRVPVVESTDLDEILSVTERQGRLQVEALASRGGTAQVVLRLGNEVRTLRGQAEPPPAPRVFEDAWDFQLQPTLDNRFGDFRIPASPDRIGPEARRFRVMDEEQAGKAPQQPETDDSGWPEATVSFGLQFWKLGPLPRESVSSDFEARIASAEWIGPGASIEVAGKPVSWQPLEFSWQWGPEGDPGHQGWHGLKEVVSDDFLQLGARHWADRGFVYRPEPGGSSYLLRSTVYTPTPTEARLRVGGLPPSAIWLNGSRLAEGTELVRLQAGFNPVLLRYEKVGRGYVVFERVDVPPATRKPDLAMTWHANPAVLPFDASPGDRSHVRWIRFTAPPGLRGFQFHCHGGVQAWVDGQRVETQRGQPNRDGSQTYAARLEQAILEPSVVALRVESRPGYHGAAAIPEPIALTCESGRLKAGDWSKVGVLAGYSGGAWYRRHVKVGPEGLRGRTTLDLGDVRASAEVVVNGRTAGIRVAPPFEFDLTPFLREGTNEIGILVCNTLANHYLTLPTRYRGDLTSGLLGPVRWVTRTPVTLVAGNHP